VLAPSTSLQRERRQESTTWDAPHEQGAGATALHLPSKTLLNALDPVTLEIVGFPELEFSYRHKEFTLNYTLQSRAWLTLSVLLMVHTWTTMTWTSVIGTGLIWIGCGMRVRYHHMPPTPSRLNDFARNCLVLNLCLVVTLTIDSVGPNANGMMVPAVEDVRLYGLTCVGHFFMNAIQSLSLGLETAFTLKYKLGMNLLCVMMCIATGFPFPSLHFEVSVVVTLLGCAVGHALARNVERRSRISFLQQTVMHDTMLLWRDMAVSTETFGR